MWDIYLLQWLNRKANLTWMKPPYGPRRSNDGTGTETPSPHP